MTHIYIEGNMGKRKKFAPDPADIELVKGVPVPKRFNRYPWSKMEIGDSFFIPDRTKRTGIYALARKRGIVVRVAYEEPGGVRVWRVK